MSVAEAKTMEQILAFNEEKRLEREKEEEERKQQEEANEGGEETEQVSPDKISTENDDIEILTSAQNEKLEALLSYEMTFFE